MFYPVVQDVETALQVKVLTLGKMVPHVAVHVAVHNCPAQAVPHFS